MVMKDMAAFFDNLASEWDNSPSEYEIRENITDMADIPKNSIIADIGCGKGVMFEHLLKREPAKLFAVDVSGEMLRMAEELFPDERIEYINNNILDIALPPIDAVIIFNAYPHFLDKPALAEKLAQMVKPSGMVVIAHSRSKEEINCGHEGGCVSKLSVTLESAEIEADKFLPFFTVGVLVDNHELYFIKMIKK